MLSIPVAARSEEGLVNYNPQEGPIIFKDSTEGHKGLHINRKAGGIETNTRPLFMLR